MLPVQVLKIFKEASKEFDLELIEFKPALEHYMVVYKDFEIHVYTDFKKMRLYDLIKPNSKFNYRPHLRLRCEFTLSKFDINTVIKALKLYRMEKALAEDKNS